MSEVKRCPVLDNASASYNVSTACAIDNCPNRRTTDLEWLEVGVNNLTKYGCDSTTIGYNTALQDIADLIRRKEGK